MSIEKFIFAGDSAGGHLTMSVAILCLLRGIKPPCGLLPLYPVLTMNLDHFFPSSLMFADDELLNTGFISLSAACMTRKGGNVLKDPIMSPLVAPDAILKLLPPTHLIACEIDGLRDEAFEMALRLLKAGIPTHLHLMSEYMHGFCNLDQNSMGVDEYRRGTNLICRIFSELLDIEIRQ